MVAFASCNNAVVVAFFSQNIKLKNVEKELPSEISQSLDERIKPMQYV